MNAKKGLSFGLYTLLMSGVLCIFFGAIRATYENDSSWLAFLIIGFIMVVLGVGGFMNVQDKQENTPKDVHKWN